MVRAGWLGLAAATGFLAAAIFHTPAEAQDYPTRAVKVITQGAAFQPVVVRVTDSSVIPLPVVGAAVTFQNVVLRPVGDAPAQGSGDYHAGNPGMPIILSATQSNLVSDGNGQASIVPSTAGFSGSLEVDVSATAGTKAALQYVLQALPVVGGASTPINRIPVWSRRARAPVGTPVREEMRLGSRGIVQY